MADDGHVRVDSEVIVVEAGVDFSRQILLMVESFQYHFLNLQRVS